MILARLHKPIYERRVCVLADRIVESLIENDRVLVIGSGSGTLAATLYKTAIAEGKPIHI
jgi:tRNA A58 N-methylase Trm61